MSKSIQIEMYSRPGCHLCDEAKVAMQPILSRYGLVLKVTDVDSSAELRDAYGWDIPVVMIEGVEAFRHRVDAGAFERKLKEQWKP